MCVGGLLGGCLGSCCASCTCSCCQRCCDEKRKSKGSLLPYLLLLAISTAAAIILLFEGRSLLIHFYTFNVDLCTTQVCLGFGSTYRISFALFAFYLTHALLLHFNLFNRLDQVSWWIQLAYFLFWLVVAFLITSPFYDSFYVEVARVVSGVFLFLQIVILVDFAYTLNEDWTSETKQYFKLVLTVSFLLYAAVIALTLIYYIYYTSADCKLNIFFITFTLLLSIALTALSISPFVDRGGLLPAGIVVLYCYYLLWSALSSDPSSCNPSHSVQSNTTLFIGLALSVLSFCYAAWDVGTSNSLFGGGIPIENNESKQDKHLPTTNQTHAFEAPQSEEMKEDRLNGNSSAAASNQNSKPPVDPVKLALRQDEVASSAHLSTVTDLDEINQRIIAARNRKFHYILAAASMYMAMLLTNWGSTQGSIHTAQGDDTVYNQSVESMWIKMATLWLTGLTFAWSLIASKVCTSRDFT